MNEEELRMLKVLTSDSVKYYNGFHDKYVLGLEEKDSLTDEVLLLGSLNPEERILNFVMEGSKFPKNLLNRTVQKLNGTFFDVFFNRDKEDQVKEEVRKRVSYYQYVFKKDNKQAILAQVSILWYSYLPCYDIQNITSEKVSMSIISILCIIC